MSNFGSFGNTQDAFRAALNDAGLPFDGELVADSVIHRFKVNGDSSPNSWYVLHSDGVSNGIFGCWKRGIEGDWCSKPEQELSEEDRLAYRKQVEEAKRKRDAEQAQRRAQARTKAQQILATGIPATGDHPYLTAKNVKAYPGMMIGDWLQRNTKDCLLIPFGVDGQVTTLQAISATGKLIGDSNKDWLIGGQKSGSYFTIGDMQSANTIVISEGYATTATIHEAIGHAVIMAGDANNLLPVAKKIRSLHPQKRLVIASDNDIDTEGNPGLKAAQNAAQAVSAALVVPDFTPMEIGQWRSSHNGKAPTDFNDLQMIRGIDGVRSIFTPSKDESTDTVNQEKTDRLFSDFGNALILKEYLSDELAFTPGFGWLGYNPNSGIWEFEPGTESIREKVMRTLREVWKNRLIEGKIRATELSKRLKGLDKDDTEYHQLTKELKALNSELTEMANWLRQCESAYKIHSALDVADGHLLVPQDAWDSTPDILVCKNGVLNLVTGELMPHSPKYFSTKLAGAHYDPKAQHPAWSAVVELLKSEGDRYELIHQFCGSGLHHENPSEQILIAQGDGGTGKGTLLTGIHKALGDYVATVEVNSLLQTDWRKQSKSAPREDLLKLRGARFVYPSIEPPKGAKLDDGAIKALTGNDVISARYPHAKRSIDFLPVFKLFMQTNFPLRTNFDDPGMKRRVIVCPFNKKPTQPDPLVKSALMNDPQAKAAVLAWLFEGYRKWRSSGYRLPASDYANEATGAYWADMNPYEDFARECLVFDKSIEASKSVMSETFKTWRETSGRNDGNLRELAKWLESKGVIDHRGTDKMRTRSWKGVGILSDITDITDKKTSKQTLTDFNKENPTKKFSENDVRSVRNVRNSQTQNPSPATHDGWVKESFE